MAIAPFKNGCGLAQIMTMPNKNPMPLKVSTEKSHDLDKALRSRSRFMFIGFVFFASAGGQRTQQKAAPICQIDPIALATFGDSAH
jgi:hypothetical protein